jgi:hypothetical protein
LSDRRRGDLFRDATPKVFRRGCLAAGELIGDCFAHGVAGVVEDMFLHVLELCVYISLS